MKKVLALLFTLALLCGCSNSDVSSLEQDSANQAQDNANHIEAVPQTPADISTEDKEPQNETIESPKTQPPECIKTFTHAALEGAVIVKSDPNTGALKYKEKCEICGNTSHSTTSTYLKGSTLSSFFRCIKCGNQQKLLIEGIMDVEWR